ncbi:hypothetical protein SAMN04487943_11246 [Gracilibacillus orientalis]|uniref:Uncharacterized protein n=1 Tax=Gracilibacillus orientalis TaxID=334253 RepID=A0A1I4PMY6_9BACI|nr:hypothetical protein [Gracilibacillus orientalis]SFM28976.1 hypothetical protein SAMN04487943_11246 [Gracilibacillus orientalis]
MEYTRSIGNYYETFEGTPKEIAELISILDKQEREVSQEKIKYPNLTKVKQKEVGKGEVTK